MISIIIPAYNAASVLPRCLDSILVQTYKDFEIIVVDDGSSDDTSIILAQYASKDNRIHPIQAKNNGASVARNRGLDLAKGDYIVFCDSDDMVSPDWLSKFMSCHDKADLISQGYVKSNGKKNCLSTKKYKGKHQIAEWIYAAAEITLWGFLWCKMFRADVVKKNKIRFDSNLKFQEDLTFILNYIQYVDSIYQLDSCCYFYIDNGMVNKYSDIPKFFSSLQCIGYLRIITKENPERLAKWEVYFQKIMIQDIIRDYQIGRFRDLQKDKYLKIKQCFPRGIKRQYLVGFSRKFFSFLVNHFSFPVYNVIMSIFCKLYLKK